ncbi:MAG TPA: family 10 glycosylhydrolase, partial [Pseudonocardiaceae bacterium]|nr:family 10 glycosylhydrolase [Pseudonocardiaceae bacterium]
MTAAQTDTDVLTLARDQVLARGIGLTEAQIRRVLELADDRLPELLALAHEVRTRWCGPEVEVEGIVSVKTGGCPEDCHFCSQSGQFPTPVRSAWLDIPGLVEAASQTAATGATEFCIVAAVRGPDDRLLTQVKAGIEAIRAAGIDINIACSLGMLTQTQIDQLVADVKAANMNAIVAQVVRRGDCFCNRAAVPRTDQPGLAPFPFDPLQTLIDKAHAQGIEVHAWVIATAFWRSGGTPATPLSPAHAFNQHGPSTTGYANWVMSRDDGLLQSNTDWLVDPGHPDAAQWIVDTATSIVANYAVDGINLDRIRYPDGNSQVGVPTWGYNPVAVARFQQATGRTDRPVASDPQWAQWRRDQITNIVRKVYIESYAIR